jgi:ribosomal-protein-alanine N-acetyltransferase
MSFYPKPYSRQESQGWIERQLRRYADNGHGLWLVVEWDSQMPVGQVALAMQEVEGIWEPEIGYLIQKSSNHFSDCVLITSEP